MTWPLDVSAMGGFGHEREAGVDCGRGCWTFGHEGEGDGGLWA